jgi:hypothetical protein
MRVGSSRLRLGISSTRWAMVSGKPLLPRFEVWIIYMATIGEEYDWLVEHHVEVEKHAGRWIAILDGKVAADGRSFREANTKAKKDHSNSVPLVIYVPRKGEELLIL